MAITDSPFVECAWAEVLHDYIGDCGELEKDLATLVAAKVERETALVAVDGGVQEADPALLTREPGRHLAADFAVGRLNLDNVCTEIGEHASAHRAGPTSGGLEHSNTMKRTGEIATRFAVELRFVHRSSLSEKRKCPA